MFIMNVFYFSILILIIVINCSFMIIDLIDLIYLSSFAHTFCLILLKTLSSSEMLISIFLNVSFSSINFYFDSILSFMLLEMIRLMIEYLALMTLFIALLLISTFLISNFIFIIVFLI